MVRGCIFAIEALFSQNKLRLPSSACNSKHISNIVLISRRFSHRYTKKFGNSRKEILLVALNPDPHGMGQTGIPFGDVSAVRDWMCLPSSVNIAKPEDEHPKRPVRGLDCPHPCVSGHRFWNEWARAAHDNPEAFFERFFVYTYCPLMFLRKSGKIISPNMIHPYERLKASEICDEALRAVVKALRPRMVVGIGGWPTERARFALKDLVKQGMVIGSLMHPSPSSYLANQGWAEKTKAKMQELIVEMMATEDVWVKLNSRS